jgi:hypothetical protein
MRRILRSLAPLLGDSPLEEGAVFNHSAPASTAAARRTFADSSQPMRPGRSQQHDERNASMMDALSTKPSLYNCGMTIGHGMAPSAAAVIGEGTASTTLAPPITTALAPPSTIVASTIVAPAATTALAPRMSFLSAFEDQDEVREVKRRRSGRK